MIEFLKKLFSTKQVARNSDGWVYLIHMGRNSYKIGCTGNIDRRLKEYKTHNVGLKRIQDRAEAHKVVEYRLLEKVLHRYFKESKIDADSKEAFKLNETNLKDFKRIIQRWATW